jgi:heme A synthase
MLESTVDLLDGLFFIAMILLTAACILGSIVAALRAAPARPIWRPVRGRVPAETKSAIHRGRELGQRTGRSPTTRGGESEYWRAVREEERR